MKRFDKRRYFLMTLFLIIGISIICLKFLVFANFIKNHYYTQKIIQKNIELCEFFEIVKNYSVQNDILPDDINKVIFKSYEIDDPKIYNKAYELGIFKSVSEVGITFHKGKSSVYFQLFPYIIIIYDESGVPDDFSHNTEVYRNKRLLLLQRD